MCLYYILVVLKCVDVKYNHTMKAIITNKFILLRNPTLVVKRSLKELLSYKDKSKAYQLRRMANNPFLKRSPQYKKLQQEAEGCLLKELPNGDLVFSSGFVHYIQSANIEIEDRRIQTGKTIPLPWKKRTFDPYPYQREAVDAMKNNYRGIINLATGLGKSLIALYATQEIKKRTLIIVPGESIAKQFLEAMQAAFGDNKVALYGGGKKKTADITIGIGASVVRNINTFKKLDLGLIVVDECFPYRQNIATIDGPMEIGKLVGMWEQNKTIPLVKSFNEKTKSFEYKAVTHAWRKTNNNLIRIKMGKRSMSCTSNHKMLTVNGWKKASELVTGELLVANPDLSKKEQHVARSLNNDQYQILLGSFLGDGNINTVKSGRHRLRVIHGAPQREYCQWKANMFHVECKKISNNGYSKKDAYRFSTKIIDIPNSIPTTKTTCPQWVIDDLDARGLAIWFMDDGTISQLGNAAEIATCSFDHNTQLKLVSKLNKMGIDSKPKFIKYNDHRAPGYWVIKINKVGCHKLKQLILPFIHSSLTYKVNNMPNYTPYNWDNTFLDSGTIPITEISYIKNKQTRTPYVFDIEVADNHNFVVCSSSGTAGPVAHNCHHIPADTFYEIANQLGDVEKIFGLSATGYRSDGKDILISAACGDTLIKRDIKWGVKNKFLAKPNFIIKEVDTNGGDFRDNKLKNYKANVLHDDAMNKQILEDIQTNLANGEVVMCLVSEVAHGKALSTALGCPFAQGNDKMSQSYVNDLNSNKIKCLVATSGKLGEGSDTKPITVLILANFIASKGPVIQAVGRGLRIANGKTTCTIIDYIPNGSKMLTRHAKQRISYYKEITDDIEIV